MPKHATIRTAMTLTGILGLSLAATAQVPEVRWDEPKNIVPAEPPPQTEMDPVVAPTESIEIRRRVAQLMLVTLSGRVGPDSEDRALLEQYTPGGVIIPMLKGPDDAASYVANLRAYEATQKIPLWIGANMFTLGQWERGMISEFSQLPTPLALAAIHDPEANRFVANLIGEYLATMGFNLHLGPCLDLPPSIPDAPGSVQCLGADLDFLADTATTFVDALREYGQVSVLAGFPGGGANRVANSPPVLLTPRSRWLDEDARPFLASIEKGAEILHVGNALVPTLDAPDAPACLSTPVMRDLLRDTLHFNGVIVAGPIDAAHIGNAMDFSEAAIRAIESGADMLYWLGKGKRVMRAVDAICAAVDEGRLTEAAIDGALRRVLAVKQSHHIRTRQFPKPKEATQLNEKRDYRKEAAHWERRSITLVQNRDRVLPLTHASAPLGVTGVLNVENLVEALHKELKSVAEQPIGSARHSNDIGDFEIRRVTTRFNGVRTAICILTEGLRPAGPMRMIHELKAQGVRVVVVLLGYPKLLPDLAEADAILLAYCHESAYARTLDGIIEVLLGRGPVAIVPFEHEARIETGQTMAFDVQNVARCPAGRLPVSLAAPYLAGLSVSYDPTCAVKSVAWDFGDGKRAKGLRVEHAYARPGRYPLAVSITDRLGETARRTLHVVVE
ncbi:MAG TPA: glycoside hydrolase family 3 N-terminal domain-containing protein [Candidatus Hydrogenedentes bacterium]|nr:glycoside hydrolase family 3 N-terminal domain-containing protein [Candidatus Hydrogenedentota bacterium]HPG69568.1 glycoside hydrolase family 3 N-terminal domain-containing protein [Candidatus Hydrogenedentota bacterium]